MNLYTDIDPDCVAWCAELVKRGLLPAGECRQADIRSMDASELGRFTQVHFFCGIGGWPLALSIAGWPIDRPVWTGSCPCQPFSSAGKKRGTSDDRHLWPNMLAHIEIGGPAIVFGEQVASKAGREWLAGVRTDLEALGYAVGCADLCAAGVAAPHVRQRIWWVAVTDGKRFEKPGQHRKDSGNRPSCSFGEADRLVDAVRRKALPFLCRRHDGVPARVGSMCARGFGGAIVPQLAAEFVGAYLDLEAA